MMNNERRNAKRIRFESAARIYCDPDALINATVETKDISLKGVFLTTDKKLPLGTECTLEVDLIGTTSSMQFTLTGIVNRQETNGMAIAFTELKPENYAHLQNLINLHNHST